MLKTKTDSSNFKLVGTEGQYIFGIALETSGPAGSSKSPYINFLSRAQDLLSACLVSRVGFEVPEIELIFKFSDQKLIPYLNERASFVVSVGKDTNNLYMDTYTMLKVSYEETGQGAYVAHLVGISGDPAYAKQPRRRAAFKTSVEMAENLLVSALGAKVEVDPDLRAYDHMLWVQPNMSDYKFLYEIWKHSYLKQSMWLPAINFERKPKIVDLRKQAGKIDLNKLPTITTGIVPKGARNMYSCLPQFEILADTAVSNNFGGYAKQRQVFDVDKAFSSMATRSTVAFLSGADLPNQAAGIATNAATTLISSNVHVNYSIAEMNNKARLMHLKSQQLDISLEGFYKNLNNLDYIIFKDAMSKGEAQKDYSGLYMIGKKAIQIVDNKIYTHLTIWREAQNELKSGKRDSKGKIL